MSSLAAAAFNGVTPFYDAQMRFLEQKKKEVKQSTSWRGEYTREITLIDSLCR